MGDKDFDDAQWGGNIVAHKIEQGADGQLYVRIPETVKGAYCVPADYEVSCTTGTVKKDDAGLKVGSIHGYSDLELGKLQKECRISFDISFGDGVKECYVLLNSDIQNDTAYFVGFDLLMQRMTFDRWPRKRNDHPFMLDLERQIMAESGQQYHVDIIKDDDVLEVYFDQKYAMSVRMNEIKDGNWGFASPYGEVCIENLEYMIRG